jgi:diguanylate cyclase (GGDEF)-like protein
MHYGTFFFTNIASVSAFTICLGQLVVHRSKIVGLRWFAAALVAGLAKLILQGLEGIVPAMLAGMIANELYLLSFFMQYLGLHWFVNRTPMRNSGLWVTLAVILSSYTVLCISKISYTGNVINIPFVAICGISAYMLLRDGKGPFKVLSRVAAAILLADMGVAAYRAVLTNLRYTRPWETVNAHSDPRWLYSLAVMAFLATFMNLSYFGFLVTELGREMAEQARTDSLTGILNRRAMEGTALREAARSARHGYPLCMIAIDIDDFKHINDTYGHAAGDRALQAMTKRIHSMLRTSDYFARMGGEEFAILLPNTSADAGIGTAERIRKEVEALEIPLEYGSVKMTISAGVTQLAASLDAWESMMRRADAAMYAAKQHGRNRVSAMLNPGDTEDCT